MIEKLRKILGLDTLEDKLIKYTNLKEDVKLNKSELNGLINEYQEIKSEVEQHESTILKSESLLETETLDILKSRFKTYLLETYIPKLKEVRNNIEKSESDINILLKDETLKKAVTDIEKQEAFDVIKKAFKQHKISRNLFEKSVYSNKVKYSDAIIRNSKGEVLFLKRNKDSDFAADEYCLPGGHVDQGEGFQDAVIREVIEETGLKVTTEPNPIHVYQDEKCIISYFDCIVDNMLINPFSDNYNIILNNDEHINYCWMAKEDWQKEKLIMNLGDVLDELFVDEIEKAAIETIQKAIEDGTLSDEVLKYI